MTFGEAAKSISAGRDEMIRWMHENGMIFRRTEGGRWEAYASEIKVGRLRMRMQYLGQWNRSVPSVRVTPKGRPTRGQHMPIELGGKGRPRKRKKAA